ncbi:Hsp20/alpha crystallin family protein [Stella sp.]|uniref:Hsp20/alpha crystallin family protein n=1 Tax=Stella sp. TaxID=2912054 RepID=UPI0035B01E5D
MTETKEAGRTPAPAPAARPFLSPFRDEFDAMFERLARGVPPFPFHDLSHWFGRGATPATAVVPAADVVETDKAYEIKVDLPGFEEKNISVELAGDQLTLKAERREEHEEKQANYHVSERRRGSCQRMFRLPDGIDRDKIAASFENGVLKVTVPKAEVAVAQNRRIAVNG